MQENNIDNYDNCLNCNCPLLYPTKPCPKCGYRRFDTVRDFFNRIFKKQSINNNFIDNNELQKIETPSIKENINDTKICDFCGNTIKTIAKKCRYCKNYLEPNDKASEKEITNVIISEVNPEKEDITNSIQKENKKNCPFCKKEINISAKKCKFCKNWLVDNIKTEEIPCPFCSELILPTAIKCKHCGEWIKKSENFKPNKKLITTGSLLGLSVAIPIIIFAYYKYNTLPSCEENQVTKQVINNIYENAFGESLDSIPEGISLQNIITVKSSSNPSKYFCKAELANLGEDGASNYSIEYNYQFNNSHNLAINVTLLPPDCSSSQTTNLAISLFKDNSAYFKESNWNFIGDKVGDVSIDATRLVNYDDKIKKYSCEANIVLKAKEGKVLTLSPFDTNNASEEIKCAISYTSQFTDKGKQQYVQANIDSSSCEYR